MNILRNATLFLFTAATAVLARSKEGKPIVPSERADEWELRLSIPGWLAGVEGDTGVHGVSTYSRLGFAEVAPKLDMVASLRAELRRGRFGVYGEFTYLSLSDGFAGGGLVKKLSFREDEYEGDLGLSWRILNGERGYLEVIGGVRYTNIFTELNLEANDEAVEDASRRLANAGTAARAVLRRELRDLSGNDPKVPGPQLGTGQAGELTRDVNALRRRQDRQKRIEQRLDRALNQRLSVTEYWFDPYIGLRGRYNLSDKFYCLGRADIGGFSIGADLSWQASAGFGVELSKGKFFEVTYRAIGVDYENDGYIYDTITHGAEASLGMVF